MISLARLVVRKARTLARIVLGRARAHVALPVVEEVSPVVEEVLPELPITRGLSTIDPTKPLYVFFAPEGGIGSHFATHCMVARSLKELGHQVLMVRCSGQYEHCIVMDMHLLPVHKTTAQRQQTCRICRLAGSQLTEQYDLPSIDLVELVDGQTIAEISSQAHSMPDDAGQFSVEGVKFGKLCGSDVALSTKTLDQMNATGEARELLEAYVSGALLSYRATQTLIRRFNVARLTFFNEYGILVGAVKAAIKAGIPTVRIGMAIHKTTDRRKIVLLHEPLGIMTYHKSLDDWPLWRDLALPAERLEIITDNNLSRLGAGGHSVYSPKHAGATDAVFEQLGLSAHRRTLVAYTSSRDEFDSNISLMSAFGIDLFQKVQPFADQIEWLKALIVYVEKSQHLQLVVRIHPREGKNARESRVSEHLSLLRRHFSEQYEHVRIVWPEEPVSSYDLAEIADVALTGWSNITMELTRLGIPTIIAFNRYVPFPVPDVVTWSPTPVGYFELIENALSRPPELDAVRFAYRWSNVYSLVMSVDFGDVIATHDFAGLPPFQLTSSAEQLEAVLVRGESIVALNRNSIKQIQSPDLVAAEGAALLRQLRRTIWFLATGEDRSDDYKLALSDNRNPHADATISLRNGFVELHTPGRVVRRRSAVISRLAQLAANVASESSSQHVG